MFHHLILSSVLVVALLAPAARADDIPARERTARTSCLSGDYAKGVALLSELFVDTRNPTYIYNQGRCFEQNRRFEDAIGRFQEYLRVGRSLSADEAADAKKHIADCKQLLSEQNPTAPPLPTPVPPEPAGPTGPAVGTVVAQPATNAPVSQPGSGLRTAGIVVGAAGVAGVVAGVLLSLKANSLASDMEKLDGYTPDNASSHDDYRNLAYVAYGVGGACIATGAILYVLGFRSTTATQPSLGLAPTLARGGAGAVLTGAF